MEETVEIRQTKTSGNERKKQNHSFVPFCSPFASLKHHGSPTSIVSSSTLGGPIVFVRLGVLADVFGRCSYCFKRSYFLSG